MRLSEQGLLTPVPAEILSQVPARYNAPAGDWVGVAARATVLVYAPSLLPETALPASLLDLAKPEWQGKVGIAPAESDFLPVVTAVIKLEGEDAAREWAEGLARNATVYLGNTPILRAVEAGQLATGVINHYYWFRMAAEVGTSAMRSKLYYFGHKDPGALVNVWGAGILASSPQPESPGSSSPSWSVDRAGVEQHLRVSPARRRRSSTGAETPHRTRPTRPRTRRPGRQSAGHRVAPGRGSALSRGRAPVVYPASGPRAASVLPSPCIDGTGVSRSLLPSWPPSWRH